MDLNELLARLGVAEDKHEDAVKAVKEYLDGSYIPKSRFNEVNAKNKELADQITARDAQLTKLKKESGDNDSLKAQIEALQKENKQAKEAADARLKDLQLTSAIKLAVAADAQDTDIVAGLINRDTIIFGEDGKVTGLNEQVEALKQSKPFLFKQAPAPISYTPKSGNGPVADNPFAKETFNLTKQGQMLRDNPEQARALASAAGVNI